MYLYKLGSTQRIIAGYSVLYLLGMIPPQVKASDPLQNAIDAYMDSAVGMMNAIIFPQTIAGDTTYVEVPEPLVNGVIVPMTAGLVKPMTESKKPVVSSMSENGATVTYAVNLPTYSTDINDYMQYIKPYKKLKTPQKQVVPPVPSTKPSW